MTRSCNHNIIPITPVIYPISTVGTYIKSFAFLLITKLGNHLMILGQPRIKKHGVIIDMINNSLVFWLGYYIYIGATFSTTLSQPKLPTETAVVRIKKDITLQKIINRGLKEDIINFLQMPNKLSSKKRRQINKSKRKTNIGKTSLRKATISSLDSFDKKNCQFPYRQQKNQIPRLKILI